MTDPVRLEFEGRHAILTLDQPPLNILDLDTIAQLDAAIVEASKSEPQLVTLRSANPETFSAGVSIQDHTPDKIDAMLDGFHGALAKLRDLSAITIAEVQGRCLGGGMELAMACDILLASDAATFAQPEIQLGCFPPYAAALYPRKIGYDRALLLLTTGSSIDGTEAERWGIATRCFANGDFEPESQEIAAKILSMSAAVTAITKQATRAGTEGSFEEALAESERFYREDLAKTEDLREGIDSFLEKRPTSWKHR